MEKHAQFNKFRVVIIVISVVFGMMILSSTISTNVIYAQQALLKKSPSTTALPSSTTPRLHAVKITSPTKGQQVITGNDLIVIGTSSDNATSNCQVSVIVNGIKPYQPATGTGHGGATDYSTWNFVLSSKYTTIKQGPGNKITAKFTCIDNPSAVSFYSVNVTGSATAASAASKQQPSAITGNSTAAAG